MGLINENYLPSKKSKIMYCVERFSPSQCPKCLHQFEKEGTDWSQRFHETNEPGIRIDLNLISCLRCGNWTPRWDHEVYQLSDLEKARVLLTLGFVNLQEVLSPIAHPDVHVWRGLTRTLSPQKTT